MRANRKIAEEAPRGLYVHIPFCRSRCKYCDFASTAGQEHLIFSYVSALCQEIASLPGEEALETIYLGGGTPSLLSLSQLGDILKAIQAHWKLSSNTEITCEVNPGTINAKYLNGLRRLGLNRISIGAQSMRDAELLLLGRIHSVSDIHIAVTDARSAGFSNINLDFIYGLPGQTFEHWQMTVEQGLELQPDHLSLYALTIEEAVPLFSDIESGILPRPDDDYVAAMYTGTVEMLRQAGWTQYELSNWARTPEHRCHHNLMYWNNHRYWGVGAAAHSWYQHTRRWNVISPREYIQKIEAGFVPTAGFEHIDHELEMGETAILGLRLMDGLSVADFLERYGVNPLHLFALAIKESIGARLLAINSRGVNLTERGKLLSNEVFWRILRDARTERGDWSG